MDYAQLVRTIITPLVDDTTNVDVKELPTSEDNQVEIIVIAKQDEISRLIGREGRTANAIRTIAKVAARKENKHIKITFESF